MNKIELEKIKQKALQEHIPIIMDDTLEVIEKYLKNQKPSRLLEIGTAVGYSAICFTEFLDENGIKGYLILDGTELHSKVENFVDIISKLF